MSAPGWHPDPAGSGRQRYFDGSEWTDQYQDAFPPPEQPKKKGRKWPWIVGGVVVLIVIVSLAGKGEDKSSSTAGGGSSSAPRSSSNAAPAGSAVRDGKFEFQVTNVARSKTVSDPTNNPYMTATAQGEFVVVTVNVTNVGDKPQSYFGQNQKLIDPSGRQYGVSSAADTYINGTENIMGEINPGNSMQVRIAFDVPPGTQAAKLELHDSMFSGGTSVLLA